MKNYKFFLEKIYYINLDEDGNKKDYFLTTINTTDLIQNCERFCAVNGKYIDIRLIDSSILHNSGRSDVLLENQKIYGISLTYGSLGCALSHILIYKEIINTNSKKPYLIFEDDIIISNDFDNKLYYLLDHIKNINYDICYLGYNNIPGFKKDPIDGVVSKPSGLITGLYGYIVSPIGAKKLLNTILPIRKQIDSCISDNQTNLNLICSSDPIINVKISFGSKTQKNNSCKNIYNNKYSNNWNKLFS